MDLLLAARFRGKRQTNNVSCSNPAAKAAAHLVNLGLSCKKHVENTNRLNGFYLSEYLNIKNYQKMFVLID